MRFDEPMLFAFLLVFVRCSAMLVTSPVFGAQNTPLPVRILTTLSISGAMTLALKPNGIEPPGDLYLLAAAVTHEAFAGVVIGMFLQLVLQAALMAGALLDLQAGLGMSQTLNPVSGVSATVLSQYKFMLAVVVFLAVNGHHVMLQAFADSYKALPSAGTQGLQILQDHLLLAIGRMSLVALQIAAPVMAVGMVVDASLGVVNKAVPQMQAFLVGLPAKILMGLVAMSLTLPALASAVQTGVDSAAESIYATFQVRR
ncbi:MAG: flagellar biosynthetic protein FliR [Fimbriimonadaceae bacterium]|nr:flagellar biosynthetic protein FliR [Fimbriimonadaceae bacterium]